MRKTIHLDSITKCVVTTNGEEIKMAFKVKKWFWWESLWNYQFIITINPEPPPVQSKLPIPPSCRLYSISSGYWNYETYFLGEFDMEKKVSDEYGKILNDRRRVEMIRKEIESLV